jgi:hypothetical protein
MESRRWRMLKRLAWIVLVAAAAAGAGCLTGSGAVRGQSPKKLDVEPMSVERALPGAFTPIGR